MFKNENLQKINEIVERFRTLYSSYGFMLTSLDVADYTGKMHKNVIRDIEVIKENISRDGFPEAGLNFQPSYYLDKNNQQRPMYKLNRIAFVTLIAHYKDSVSYQLALLLEALDQILPPSMESIARNINYNMADDLSDIYMEQNQFGENIRMIQLGELYPELTPNERERRVREEEEKAHNCYEEAIKDFINKYKGENKE